MPEMFPVLNDDGEVVQVPHYTVSEIAEMFHTSRATVYSRMREGEWPYMRIVRTVYFSAAQVTEILARSTRDDGRPGGLHRETAERRARREGGA